MVDKRAAQLIGEVEVAVVVIVVLVVVVVVVAVKTVVVQIKLKESGRDGGIIRMGSGSASSLKTALIEALTSSETLLSGCLAGVRLRVVYVKQDGQLAFPKVRHSTHSGLVFCK